MNKQELINQYQKNEDQYFIANVLDKISFAKTRNQLVHTCFLDEHQRTIVEKIIKEQHIENYKLFGGVEQAERVILILYPDKLRQTIQEKRFDYGTIMKVIRITLPNEIKGNYSHKDYLSGLMKLGIKREKIGDIFVSPEGADILICEDIFKYLWSNLSELTRFQKSKIEEIEWQNIRKVEKKTEEIRITVPSLRLDAIVAELACTSRGKANEMMMQERVLLNSCVETKFTKMVKEQDKITIRGKGRFYITKIEGETKKGKIALKLSHDV